jgi:hypothetical protein
MHPDDDIRENPPADAWMHRPYTYVQMRTILVSGEMSQFI